MTGLGFLVNFSATIKLFLFGNLIFRATTVILLTMYSRSMKGSLMATTLMPFSRQALKTRRPIRPKLE